MLRFSIEPAARIARRALFGVALVAAGIASAQQPAFTPRDETPEEFTAGAGRDETFYTCTA